MLDANGYCLTLADCVCTPAVDIDKGKWRGPPQWVDRQAAYNAATAGATGAGQDSASLAWPAANGAPQVRLPAMEGHVCNDKGTQLFACAVCYAMPQPASKLEASASSVDASKVIHSATMANQQLRDYWYPPRTL